ncbi:MAG: hypothetical protein QNJ60_13450 [Xenococcaceae cyanobacterium MO_188.B19]|nr:hypothetical protein [Xenococcaceae cyanobacterium MO_188.B19]
MKDKIIFITKVLIASWLLSVGIKYTEKILVLAPTNINAISIVFAPCFAMVAFLGWKYLQDINNTEIKSNEKP